MIVGEVVEKILCQSEGPARGAWLKQQILREQPGFDERALGFASFREFVESLQRFRVLHDGTDILVELSDSPATPSNGRRSSDRVAPALWRAFIRSESAHDVFLDKMALTRGYLELVTPPLGSERDRFVRVPVSDRETLRAWLVTWCRESLKDEVGAKLAQLAEEEELPKVENSLREMDLFRSWSRYRAQRCLDRLYEWAKANELSWAPPILLSGAHVRSARKAPSESRDYSIYKLAQLVVQHLPEDRLRAIEVPLGAVLDALNH